MPTDSSLIAENAAEATHTRLRDSILSGELRPRQRLVEVDLAELLGVSRTPVREALLRLRQEGLVSQKNGWFVRDLDPAEVLEFLEARALLESATAGLAAARRDDATIPRLRELLAQMDEPGISRVEINALNSRFHATITAASGNGVLTAFARSTDINYWNFATPVVFTEADDRQVSLDHHALVDAVERGDHAEASRIALEHVHRTAAILARSLGLQPRVQP